MALLLFVSRNGTNLFDVIKNKNEKGQRAGGSDEEGGEEKAITT
jgi:hypothetical protein